MHYQLELGMSEPIECSFESRSARFLVPIQSTPKGHFKSIKVEMRFEAVDPYCRFPFNVWVRVGASARLVRIIEFNSTQREEVFFLPIEDTTFVLIKLDCDAGIFDGANYREGRRIRLKVAFSDIEPDTMIPRLPSIMESALQHSPFDIGERPLRPIFVVGMYRSGTSILTWALGQHPNIWALEETGFLPMIANSAAAAWERASNAGRSFADVYELSQARFNAHLGHFINGLFMELAKEHAMRCVLERANDCAPDFDPRIQALRSLGSPKHRWLDGTPENTVAIWRLSQLFPEARFIHVVRNPVNVAASMMRFDRIGGISIPAAEAGRLWYDRVMLGFLAEKALGSQVVMRVMFDELVSSPRSTLNRIFSFLGEPAFDQASHCYQEKINSSEVSTADTEEALNMIDELDLKKYLDFYNEISDTKLVFHNQIEAARTALERLAHEKLLEFLAT